MGCYNRQIFRDWAVQADVVFTSDTLTRMASCQLF